MESVDYAETARRAALDRVDKADRAFKVAFVGGALFEGVFLALLIWAVDFSDPTHRVIFVAALLVYGALAIAIIALGLHVSRGAERILKALSLLRQDGSESAPAN